MTQGKITIMLENGLEVTATPDEWLAALLLCLPKDMTARLCDALKRGTRAPLVGGGTGGGRQRAPTVELRMSKRERAKMWPSRNRSCVGGCGRSTRAGRCRYCKPRTFVPCPKCGAQFWAWARGASHARRYCADDATHASLASARAIARTIARKAGRAAELSKPRPCPWCFTPFVPRLTRRTGLPNAGQKYCCFQHQNIAKSKRRKARQRGAQVGQPLSLWAIYERDDGCCGLCGETVNRHLRWPDQGAPSIDHINPISRGGKDNPENLQLAHLRCNLRKSAQTIEGYRLRFSKPIPSGAGQTGARFARVSANS